MGVARTDEIGASEVRVHQKLVAALFRRRPARRPDEDAPTAPRSASCQRRRSTAGSPAAADPYRDGLRKEREAARHHPSEAQAAPANFEALAHGGAAARPDATSRNRNWQERCRDQSRPLPSEGPTPSTLKNCGPVSAATIFAVAALGLEHRVAPHIGGHAFERLRARAENLGLAVTKAQTDSEERRSLRQHHHVLRIAVGERPGDMPQHPESAAEHRQKQNQRSAHAQTERRGFQIARRKNGCGALTARRAGCEP